MNKLNPILPRNSFYQNWNKWNLWKLDLDDFLFF